MKQSENILIRVTPEFKNKVEDKVKENELSVSSFIKTIIKKHLD